MEECGNIIGLDSALYSSPEYSPWEHVEYAPRDEIYDSLLSLCESVRSSPKKSKPVLEPASLVGVAGAPPSVPLELIWKYCAFVIEEAECSQEGFRKELSDLVGIFVQSLTLFLVFRLYLYSDVM